MATLTVNYIAYDKIRNRRNGHVQKSVISSLKEMLSDDEDYTLSVLPILEHEGNEVHFAFLAASGTADGCLLSFNAGTQNIPVGHTDIQVAVVYLPQVPDKHTVVADAFNLEKADFTNSDFIDVLADSDIDNSKTAEVNELGTLSSEKAEKLQAHDSVDGTRFSVWKSFPGKGTLGKRESVIEPAQNGYLFAFYGGEN
ncbi:MAG: hypothetical protein A3D31_06185 [Candidatus Fluviicola riflensis]|nr:MAG: hypothetical protein CHH17_08830 [Candidatus Fluviicola riflensis]OGS79551.1 MAG: hypothetical protein A3D31_06185 [Candidatus Fluviicola riflensis]OGS86982.1 MAG: hypothetical protein A2724_05645 [Fluviicola sp. RIFCSPHIGHO2_01_FULL_43_53]OGS89773.1 MAG: hypothetical protein A3E30_02390 [Fluviicola sp. RIFCSPHIGHO2_12_FULL_43_24]